jgi:hypothetical protein
MAGEERGAGYDYSPIFRISHLVYYAAAREVAAMNFLRVATLLGSLLFCGIAVSGALEPEACILDTLKGGAAKESLQMIRWNCVSLYLKSAERYATLADSSLFASATAQWSPAGTPFTSNRERFVVTLKNGSEDRIISADVAILNKKTKQQEVYRAYVDYPIDPGTVGRLEFESITGATDDFWKQYTWGLVKVYVVPVP